MLDKTVNRFTWNLIPSHHFFVSDIYFTWNGRIMRRNHRGNGLLDNVRFVDKFVALLLVIFVKYIQPDKYYCMWVLCKFLLLFIVIFSTQEEQGNYHLTFRRGCMFSEKNIYSKTKKQDINNRILKFSTRNLCKFGKILIFHVQEKKMIWFLLQVKNKNTFQTK